MKLNKNGKYTTKGRELSSKIPSFTKRKSLRINLIKSHSYYIEMESILLVTF